MSLNNYTPNKEQLICLTCKSPNCKNGTCSKIQRFTSRSPVPEVLNVKGPNTSVEKCKRFYKKMCAIDNKMPYSGNLSVEDMISNVRQSIKENYDSNKHVLIEIKDGETMREAKYRTYKNLERLKNFVRRYSVLIGEKL